MVGLGWFCGGVGVVCWWFGGGVRVVRGGVGMICLMTLVLVVVWGGVGWHHGGRCAITGRGRTCTSLIQYAR